MMSLLLIDPDMFGYLSNREEEDPSPEHDVYNREHCDH